MKLPALLAAALAVCSVSTTPGSAGDGDLTPPPAAKGHPSGATVGFECPSMSLDPCRNVTGGKPVCEDGEWVCENGCKGGPPPCVSGKSGQCVDGQWRCVITDGCAGGQPECGAGKTAKCEAGGWKCELACDTQPPACAPGLAPKCMGGFGGGWQCWTSDDRDGHKCSGEKPLCPVGAMTRRVGGGDSGGAVCADGRWTCPGEPNGDPEGRPGERSGAPVPTLGGRGQPPASHGDPNGNGKNSDAGPPSLGSERSR